MNPEDANPKNFKVEKIIYNEDGFSVAIGVWQEDETRRFAMRWNGSNIEDKGYPSVFVNPMWFQLPQDVTSIVKTLLENSDLKIKKTL
jgi:hypothetical protein